MLKYILFGTGTYYKKNIERIKSRVEVVALLDNNKDKYNSYIDGWKVSDPIEVNRQQYDKILLVAAGFISSQMRDQLMQLGVDEDKIQFLDEFYGDFYPETFVTYGERQVDGKHNSIALISTDLDYNGGTIAVCNMARALCSNGNDVTLVVPDASFHLVEEIIGNNLIVAVCPAIVCAKEKLLKRLEKYDVIIVNTIQMIDIAVKCRYFKPILWWIHEPSDAYSTIYKNTFSRYPWYKEIGFENITIMAVSNIAKKNFNYYFPEIDCSILPYGLPDYAGKMKYMKSCERRLIFAMIGYFCELKAQKEFIEAALAIKEEYCDMAEFWIIGEVSESSYSREVVKIASQLPNVTIWGAVSQKEIQNLYRIIDVVVCPSYEDCLPIVVTEGFMNSKTCIVSSNTGSAQYIRDRENGLICKPGDVDSLVECMEWCIDNKDQLEVMGLRARIIYDENFTMNRLQERLATIIDELMV